MDLYHKLLGIPPEEQPPDLYRLLGLRRFESDPEVISNAARRQHQFVKSATLAYSKEAERLLNEIMAAKVLLLNTAKKGAYDETLRAKIAGAGAAAGAPLSGSGSPVTSGSPLGGSSGGRGSSGFSEAQTFLIPWKTTEEDPAPVAEISGESWEFTPPVSPSPEAIDAEWVVGSGPEAQIRVRAPWVSRRHCLVRRMKGKATVEDLGSTNGTYVNEVEVDRDQPAPIEDDDVVTLGRKTLLPWPLPVDCPGKDLRVFSIGRSAECDFVINDKSVSEFHAQLLVENETVTLEDRVSLNGTFVGRPDNKIERCELQGHLSVFFGGVKVFGSQLIEVTRKGVAL